MNLLYISYWGIDGGLTSSTIFPYLKYLSEEPKISKILFCTIEREGQTLKSISLDKVEHCPIFSKNIKPSFLNKLNDINLIKKKILQISNKQHIDISICKSSMAGIFGNFLYKKKGINYIVDSFEPHADYMMEAKTWSRFGLKYLFQKRLEKEIKKNAQYLITVSSKYQSKLIEEGVSKNKIDVTPSCVDVDRFKFNLKSHKEFRKKLNIQNALVGIYVGKFGDIYYDNEAFEIFETLFKEINKFFLIILTPNSEAEIKLKLESHNIKLSQTYVTHVPHNEVINYLNASDFAISTIKPTYSRQYCSPIKHGEYWANGLPIFASCGAGDDDEIIVKENGGVLYNYNEKLGTSIFRLKNEMPHFNRFQHNNNMFRIAKKYRGFDIGFNNLKKSLQL